MVIKVKEVIVFIISGKQYGIEIGGMQSLEKYQEIQPFPDAPDFILGTVKIRGAIIPVFDINRIIGLPAAQKPAGQPADAVEQRKILLLRTKAGTLACIVDGVENVFRAEGEDVQPVPQMTRTEGTGFLDFIIRRDNKLVVVIQPKALFTDEQVKSIQETDFTRTEKEEEGEEEEGQEENKEEEEENEEKGNKKEEKQERLGVL